MVRRSVVTALCVMLLFLVACKSKPKVSEEPINHTRVADNRAILDKCFAIMRCDGGFAIDYRSGRIKRIVLGDWEKFETVGIRFLSSASDEVINRFEFVLPGDRPKWDKVAVAYSLQFTPIPAPH